MNWGIFGVGLRGFWPETEGCVEVTSFLCGTEGFWGLKRSGPSVLNSCVELRGSELRGTR